MELLAGLFNGQVLQRNSKDVCETIIVGQSAVVGELLICVVRDGQILNGWEWRKIADVGIGEFECLLKGIPVGGPYVISLRIGDDEITIENVLVGDVWILGGQSNMEGVGLLVDAETPHPQVRAFYMNDQWHVAKESIHVVAEAIDPIHAAINGDSFPARDPAIGVGPGVSFGKRMMELSGVPQGLICCAHGGASMTQYTAEPHDRSGRSLYSAVLRKFWKNGQRVAGVIWYQGCNDACTETGAEHYTEKMVHLVNLMRRDFAYQDLPFVMAQLATMFGLDAVKPVTIRGWNSVREQQRLMPEHLPRLTVVPSIDLLMTDPIHLTAGSQKRMGRRFAEAAWTLKGGKNSQKEQIVFESARWITGEISGGYLTVEVLFGNIVGTLESSGAASGFMLTDKRDVPLPLIFRTDVNGSRVLLHTTIKIADETRNMRLYYGFSSAAYCNIHDKADRSLPAFGPVMPEL